VSSVLEANTRFECSHLALSSWRSLAPRGRLPHRRNHRANVERPSLLGTGRGITPVVSGGVFLVYGIEDSIDDQR